MLKFDFRPLNTYFGRKFKKKLNYGIELGFENAVEWLTDYSRTKHPTFKNRSGNLAKSLKYRVRKTDAVISSDVFYSEYLYYGTRDHFIAPVNASALSWTQGGQRFYSKGHMVSGIKKSVWIRRNYEEKHKRFNHFVEYSVRKEFE